MRYRKREVVPKSNPSSITFKAIDLRQGVRMDKTGRKHFRSAYCAPGADLYY